MSNLRPFQRAWRLYFGLAGLILSGLFLSACASPGAATGEAATGPVRVETASFQELWVRPDEDFSGSTPPF